MSARTGWFLVLADIDLFLAVVIDVLLTLKGIR